MQHLEVQILEYRLDLLGNIEIKMVLLNTGMEKKWI